MDPATWPIIGDVIKIFTNAADKLIPDRNQRFSMSVEASTGNIRTELGGNWLNSNWRAVVSLGIWGEIFWWLDTDKVIDWRFWFLAGLGIICLTGYTLNRETLSNVAEFFKLIFGLKKQQDKDSFVGPKEKGEK